MIHSNRWVRILLLSLLFMGIGSWCNQKTRGFRLQTVISDLPARAEWETDEGRCDVRARLQQTFRFLGNGGQFYAFLGEDGQTVLKLFKHNHMRPAMWSDHLPLPSGLRRFVLNYRRGKLHRMMESCLIAYRELPEQTGLLYAHINPTNSLHSSLHILDPIGIAHTLPADTTTFLLQERAELVSARLRRLTQEGQSEALEGCVEALLDHVVTCCAHGVQDIDPAFRKNFGFISDRAVEIDLGSFVPNPLFREQRIQTRELYFEARTLARWLREGGYTELANRVPQIRERVAQRHGLPLFE